VTKANHAATGTTISLEWRDKLLVPVLSSRGILGAIQRRTADRVFIDLLDATASQGRRVSDSKHAGNYAPKAFAASPRSERHTSKDFAVAMERLFAEGVIGVEPYGRKSDERSHIIRRPKIAAEAPMEDSGRP
jgi:hypothetical protein